MKSIILLFVIVVGLVNADLYLQNPRGSNNRLNSATDDAQTQNRMFNSQNNARGGYNVGPALSYVEGSLLPIQWTAQHGCGTDQVQCNILAQYMCTDPVNDPQGIQIRDGLTEDRIQDNANTFNQKTTVNGVTGFQYGMHESYQSYQDCKNRERNQGLFTADQALNGNTAIYTRQDAAGSQNGFECNEERDYYPYWAPSPWKDIVALAPTEALCDYFKAESQNVVPKNYCAGVTKAPVPIQEAACVAAGGTWTAAPAHGIAAPDCQLAPYSRDNHLGNTLDGDAATYNWTIPAGEPCATAGGCNCALRLRYNVSTADTNNWGLNGAALTDSTQNGKAASPITGDPVSQLEGDDLQMALDTNQLSRTFEDRSFVFNIAPRPQGLAADAAVYNLNVRGKRGNIVQTFPATEYDFVPNSLNINAGDYVHFQWTGADTNPAGNAGEGTDQTDRSNIVQIASLANNVPLTQDQIDAGGAMFDDPTLRHSLAFLDQTNCPTIAQLLAKNNNNQDAVDTDKTNCAKLNAASAYYDAGPVRVEKPGTFYYMSSRNNNFSNRTQKGMLVVNPLGLSKTSIALAVSLSVIGAVVVSFAGTYVYARQYPDSKLAGLYNKLPSIPRPKWLGGGSSSAATYSNYSAYTAKGDNQKPLLG